MGSSFSSQKIPQMNDNELNDKISYTKNLYEIAKVEREKEQVEREKEQIRRNKREKEILEKKRNELKNDVRKTIYGNIPEDLHTEMVENPILKLAEFNRKFLDRAFPYCIDISFDPVPNTFRSSCGMRIIMDEIIKEDKIPFRFNIDSEGTKCEIFL